MYTFHETLQPKKYSPGAMYITFYKTLKTFPFYVRAVKRTHILDDQFSERIMLAVTEVNGCEVCSYAHTRMALEKGLDKEEIRMMLTGNTQNIPKEEYQAILFAQHYADTKGHPSRESWKKVLGSYGKERAFGILGSIRIMMLGNVIGLPISSFINRCKGKKPPKSTLAYELVMMILPLFLLPAAAVHVLFSVLLRVPVIRFTGSE